MWESRVAACKAANSGNQLVTQKSLKKICRSRPASVSRRVKHSFKWQDPHRLYRQIRVQRHDLACQQQFHPHGQYAAGFQQYNQFFLQKLLIAHWALVKIYGFLFELRLSIMKKLDHEQSIFKFDPRKPN